MVGDCFSELRNKRVLVTGHTGFKGAWLCEWLLQEKVTVGGLALPPQPGSNLFTALELQRQLNANFFCDVRDPTALTDAVSSFKPDVVIHLAAQALVRESYRDPQYTWDTNVLGTLNLLQVVRAANKPITVIVATTDKVYKNRGWEYAYREIDELGGHDPYSASKAACELCLSSWRSSFAEKSGVKVISARAGNVIGPGDFSRDRLVPDCFAAWREKRNVILRNPHSTRPWQHVLEPLSGYLSLALYSLQDRKPTIDSCNFGPGDGGDFPVVQLVEALANSNPKRTWIIDTGEHLHEAPTLALSIERAKKVLGWSPRLSFKEMVTWTERGYTEHLSNLAVVVRDQIAEYRTRS